MNVDELVGKYAWIEFAIDLELDTIEYTLWINWLNGSLYAKRILIVDSAIVSSHVTDMEIDRAVFDFISHLEKLE